MSDPKESGVSRRDALRLASAVGALGAGLGITLTPNRALAVESSKYKIAAGDIGTMVLKISSVSADGKEQLITALDLTASFMKLAAAPAGFSVAFHLGSQKGDNWLGIFNHSVEIPNRK